MPPKADMVKQNANNEKAHGPDENSICSFCNEKTCFGVMTTGTGSQKREKKQKVKFEWIACDICCRWYHGNCQGLQPEEVISITKLDDRGVKWFCADCLPSLTEQSDRASLKKLAGIEQMIASLDNKVDTYQNQTTEEVKRLEKSWAEIASPGELSQDIKKAVQLTSTTQALLSKDLDKKDTEARKNNAILYGLPENKTAMDDIQELMKNEFFQTFNVPEQAVRLGAKTESHRPIKLRFANETAKWEFIKRANSKLREKNIFCKLDVSAQTREQEFKLRERVRALRQNKDDSEYRIRNGAIQQKDKTTGEWVRMKPETQQRDSLV